MSTTSHPTRDKAPFWKRFFQAVAAYEDAMEFDPTERAVAALQNRTAVLDELGRGLEAIGRDNSHS